MGPKKQQTEKDSVIIEHEEIEQSDLEILKQKLLASEKEKQILENKLRDYTRESAQERDKIVASYQQRINDINNDKDTQIQHLEEERNSLRDRESQSVSSADRTTASRQKYDVPLPRPVLFDGKNSWESFIHPFEAMREACGWDESEQLFRLKNSLRGEASEFAFWQLSQETLSSYVQLKAALSTRFEQKRSTSSYLAELENRKFNREKESLSEYVASVKRLVMNGYPTADSSTRETISLRHFLRGLQDPQAALFIGMSNPSNTDQARELFDNYVSIKDDVKSVRIRNVDISKESYVTTSNLDDFGRGLRADISREIRSQLSSQSKQRDDSRDQGGTRRSRKDVECFSCHRLGHYAHECAHNIRRSEN